MILEIIIPICSSLIGSIFLVIIKEYSRRNSMITSIDDKKFILYKYLYFQAVKTPLGKEISTNKAISFFNKFYNHVAKNEEVALLLGDDTLKLLLLYHNKGNTEIYKLQNKIEYYFTALKKKYGYYIISTKTKILWYISCSIFLNVFTILYVCITIFPRLSKEIGITYCFLFYLAVCILVLKCFLYAKRNFYTVFN